MVMAPIVRGRKGEYGKQLQELRAEGFTRVKVDGELRQLDEEISLDKRYKHDISVVVDRLVMRPDLRKRLADSVETAVALADGIIKNAQSDLREIHNKSDAEVDVVRMKARGQMREFLTPEQMPKFEEYMKRMDEERKKQKEAQQGK